MILTKINETVEFDLTKIPIVKKYISSNISWAEGMLDKFGVFPILIVGFILVITLLMGLKKWSEKSEKI